MVAQPSDAGAGFKNGSRLEKGPTFSFTRSDFRTGGPPPPPGRPPLGSDRAAPPRPEGRTAAVPFSSSSSPPWWRASPGAGRAEHRRLPGSSVDDGGADHDFSNPEMEEIQVPTPWQGLVRQELSSCRCRQLAE